MPIVERASSIGLTMNIADQIRNLCREILKTKGDEKRLECLCQLRFLLHDQAQQTHDKSSEALENLLESERHIKDN